MTDNLGTHVLTIAVLQGACGWLWVGRMEQGVASSPLFSCPPPPIPLPLRHEQAMLHCQ
eukprot:CAMPEP_0113234908 /NCGR_PEP_ID=MMETSP0008_2-20120614/3279_1 /TAXON_ID=97485 /ORGANISM="Prymnesium parvum" /LENGTH=58 /DNA_ID=CAMNT_0000081811 /DNA_START=16 /DNA_END=189 /DNA_ORIENTATION=- /assembly_acc=CAM_ASM_000153